MSLIHNSQIEAMAQHLCLLLGCKVIGADNNPIVREWIFTFRNIRIKDLCIKDFASYTKLLCKFKTPLFSQRSWTYNDDFTLACGPHLTENKSCFYRLSQSHFISKDDTFTQWRLKGKQSRINLVWIDVNSRIKQRLRKILQIVAYRFLRKQLGIVFSVISSNHFVLFRFNCKNTIFFGNYTHFMCILLVEKRELTEIKRHARRKARYSSRTTGFNKQLIFKVMYLL